MSGDAVLGLDIGTSSVKALVVDDDGRVLARTTRSYPTTSPRDGAAEQNPDDWTTAIAASLGGIEPLTRRRIRAVGLCGHVPSLVLVDARHRPVRPAISWQDARAAPQAERLAERFGDVSERIGTPVPWSASQLPAKLRWVADHEPDAPARTSWILQPKDYVLLELTGSVATDAWSSKGLCDVRTGAPVPDILEAAGFAAEQLPATGEAWRSAGRLRRDVADRLGLPHGIPVATGWSDALAAMLAVGAFERPTAFVLTGTSDIVGVSAPAVSSVDGVYRIPRPVAPLESSYGPTQSSGASLNWIADVLGTDVAGALAAVEESDGGGAGPADPVFVPYLSGERAPVWDGRVRGAFHGLDARHDRAALVRAVLDGVSLSARHVLDTALRGIDGGMREAIDRIEVGGRSAASSAWIASRRRTLDAPIAVHPEPSLSALGAAMLGALAAGAALGDLEGLRAEPRIVRPGDGERATGAAAFRDYLEASRLALAWTDRDRPDADRPD